MPFPLWGLLSGLALGGAKYGLGKARAKKDRELAAETQRYSPWTGLKANEVREPSLVGDLVGGGFSGASFEQNLDQADLWNTLLKQQAGVGDGTGLGVSEPWNMVSNTGVDSGSGIGMNIGKNYFTKWGGVA